MGAKIAINHGYIEASSSHLPNGRLHGAKIFMDQVTVTGTENLAATNSSMRIMVSPFRTKLSSDGPVENFQNATEMAKQWKADDEKVNRDYIESLLDAIENGEL